MTKVRTLSRTFPNGHVREGQPTYFVAQVLNAVSKTGINVTYQHIVDLNQDKIDKGLITESVIWKFWYNVLADIRNKVGSYEKLHTIRANNPKTNEPHFTTGDKIQLAVWTGKPYASHQIRICPELEVVCYDFEVEKNHVPTGPEWIPSINGNELYDLEKLAINDGLSLDDFKSWFKYPSEFDGQIIAWVDPKY